MLIRYSEKELDLCARLMRAEALSDGNLGMLMVGNVIVNRTIASCLDFKNIRTITDAIYQKNQFSGINSSLFFKKATENEKTLAKRVLKGESFHPATHSLFFYYPGKEAKCKEKWFNQNYAGNYKSHCFYEPDEGVCKELY